MEITFGATMGAALGLGVWLNRARIATLEAVSETTLPAALEWALVGLHVSLLLASEFTDLSIVGLYSDLSLLLALIPIVAIAGGRWWPLLVALPITLLPIALKTVRRLVYQDAVIAPALGWLLYAILPLAATTTLAILFVRTVRGARWRTPVRTAHAPRHDVDLLRPELRVLPLPVAVGRVDHAHAERADLPGGRPRVDVARVAAGAGRAFFPTRRARIHREPRSHQRGVMHAATWTPAERHDRPSGLLARAGMSLAPPVVANRRWSLPGPRSPPSWRGRPWLLPVTAGMPSAPSSSPCPSQSPSLRPWPAS